MERVATLAQPLVLQFCAMRNVTAGYHWQRECVAGLKETHHVTSLLDMDVSYTGLSNHVSLCVRIGRYVSQSRHPGDNTLSSYRMTHSQMFQKVESYLPAKI